MSTRPHSALERLRSLCSEPGFLYAFVCLLIEDRFQKVSDAGSDMESGNQWHGGEPGKLIDSEMLLLLHFICECEVDFKTVPGKMDLERMERSARNLLGKIHEGFQAGMMEPLVEMLGRGKQKDDDPSGLVSSDSLREGSLYAEEPGYFFQYLPMAGERYSKDADCMSDALGFVASDMVQVLEAVLFGLTLNLNEVSGTPESYLSAFAIDFGWVEEQLKGYVKSDRIRRVIDFFTAREVPMPRLEDFGDENELMTNPIVRIGGKRYLFFPNVLCRSAYDSPYGALFHSDGYSDIAKTHRGDFTESFVYERFVSVFGEKNVYRNVNFWRGRNKSSEIDVLAVVADRAILVQCKSKVMTQQAQQGDVPKAGEDFMKAVGGAYQQNVRCAHDLLDPSIDAKDADGKPVRMPRDFSRMYPISVVSDPYPSLDAQTHEYLPLIKPLFDVKELAAPIATDVFFIDVLAEILDKPLLVIDYLDHRCAFGSRLSAETELAILDCYLLDGFDMDVGGAENLVVAQDFGIEVNEIMSKRRVARVEDATLTEGVLARAADTGEPYSEFFRQAMDPRDAAGLEFGLMLLAFRGPQISEFNSWVGKTCSACTCKSPIHSMTVGFSNGLGISLIAADGRAPQWYRSKVQETICGNDRSRGGEWFVVTFDSASLHILGLERVGKPKPQG